MISLPHELQRQILCHLDLDDLARCEQVSRDLRDRVREVLSTITAIHHKEEYAREIWWTSLAFVIDHIAPRNTLSRTEVSNDNVSSFLRFVTEKCPNVSSLMANDLCVYLDDIRALAPRLICFSLREITLHQDRSLADLIDAKSLAENFPNLQFFKLRRAVPCPYEITREYSLLASNQFAQYRNCDGGHNCETFVDARSIDSLRSLRVEIPFALHELRPSSLNSLQMLRMSDPVLDSENLPQLPNLLFAGFRCLDNLNRAIHLMYKCPKLLAMSISGFADEQSIPALKVLLSTCPALKILDISFFPDGVTHLDHEASFDCSESKSLKKLVWHSSSIPVTVIIPPECGHIEYNLDTVCFNVHGKIFELGGKSVSFALGVLAHPVELVIKRGCERSVINEVMAICPRISVLTLRYGYIGEAINMIPILVQLLLGSDVGDIVLKNDAKHQEIGQYFFKTFFSAINNHPTRSFSILISGQVSLDNLKSVLVSDVPRTWTMSCETRRSSQKALVKIYRAVGVLPTQ